MGMEGKGISLAALSAMTGKNPDTMRRLLNRRGIAGSANEPLTNEALNLLKESYPEVVAALSGKVPQIANHGPVAEPEAVTQLRAELEAARKRVSETEKAHGAMYIEHCAVVSERDAMRTQLSDATAKLADAGRTTAEAVREASDRNAELHRTLADTERTLADVSAKLERALSELSAAEAANADLSGRTVEQDADIVRLSGIVSDYEAKRRKQRFSVTRLDLINYAEMSLILIGLYLMLDITGIAVAAMLIFFYSDTLRTVKDPNAYTSAGFGLFVTFCISAFSGALHFVTFRTLIDRSGAILPVSLGAASVILAVVVSAISFFAVYQSRTKAEEEI